MNIYKFKSSGLFGKKSYESFPMPGIRRILNFSISPDGKKIVFQMAGEKEYGISIWTVSTDGANLKLLVKYGGDPSWSPDGSQIAYASKLFSHWRKNKQV